MWRPAEIVVAASLVTVVWGECHRTEARGGAIRQPRIGIPVDGAKLQDPVCTAFQKILNGHHREFANGWSLNNSSILHFQGGTGSLNDMMRELSAVEGAELTIEFKNSVGLAECRYGDPELPATPCQWSIAHNSWANPHAVQLTVYLGDGKISMDEVVLPKITSPSPHEASQ